MMIYQLTALVVFRLLLYFKQTRTP